MANHEKGELSVEVGGKSYTLRPTFDAMAEYEDRLGRDVADMYADLQKSKLVGLRSVVWCLLHEHHGDEIRSLKDASAWIEAIGVDDAWDVVNRALTLNQNPASEAADTANPPDAQAGTGEVSSLEPVGSV